MAEQKPSSVAPWNPFADFDPFGDWPSLATSAPFRSLLGEARRAWSPAIDISENDDQYVVTCELAGAKRDDVTVETDEGVLTIKGEKRSERKEEDEERRYVERTFGRFSRSFTLPSNADPNAINARFGDGVLTIEIAKREAEKPKTIAVK